MTAKADLKYVKYPCYVQPKLDGFRCMIDLRGDAPVFISRSGADAFELPNIQEQLKEFKGLVLDGELYAHDQPFNEISKLIKNPEVQGEVLRYHVYDLPHDEEPFKLRLRRLEALRYTPLINSVGTFPAESLDEIKELHKGFLRLGYEGTMIRNAEGLYKYNGRSADLVKYKDFIDEEFEVVDVVEGEGTKEGHGIPVISLPGDRTQEVTMAWTHEQQAELLENKAQYIGRLLTVKYHGLTKNKYLRHTSGIRFREDFDIGS